MTGGGWPLAVQTSSAFNGILIVPVTSSGSLRNTGGPTYTSKYFVVVDKVKCFKIDKHLLVTTTSMDCELVLPEESVAVQV